MNESDCKAGLSRLVQRFWHCISGRSPAVYPPAAEYFCNSAFTLAMCRYREPPNNHHQLNHRCRAKRGFVLFSICSIEFKDDASVRDSFLRAKNLICNPIQPMGILKIAENTKSIRAASVLANRMTCPTRKRVRRSQILDRYACSWIG